MYAKSKRFQVKTDQETSLWTVFWNSLKHGAPSAGLSSGSGKPEGCVFYGGEHTDCMVPSELSNLLRLQRDMGSPAALNHPYHWGKRVVSVH